MRDAGGALLLDLETAEDGVDDDGLQRLAWAMEYGDERATVLARWPERSWTGIRPCVGEALELSVPAPHRCLVAHADGKPVPDAFGRGSEVRCAVVNGGPAGAVLNGYATPVRDGDAPLPGFPVQVGACETARVEYRLATERNREWHVAHLVTATAVRAFLPTEGC